MSYLEIRDVTVEEHAKRILQNISFKVEKGEVFAVVGPSGVGKTTLLRTLCGLQPITSGDIWMNGKSIKNTLPHHRGMAAAFSNDALFEYATVEKNITYGLHACLTVKEIAERTEKISHLLEISPLLSRLCCRLSTGEKQRVVLARALMQYPSVLLLDEPFSALDVPLKRKLQDTVFRFIQEENCTCIQVVHDQSEALEQSDHVLVLHNGKVEEVQSSDTILSHPHTYFTAHFFAEETTVFLERRAKNKAIDLFGYSLPVSCSSVVHVRIRPEDITVADSGLFEGIVQESRKIPLGYVISFRIQSQLLTAYSSTAFQKDSSIRFNICWDTIQMFE